jgi:hypothetical protein
VRSLLVFAVIVLLTASCSSSSDSDSGSRSPSPSSSAVTSIDASDENSASTGSFKLQGEPVVLSSNNVECIVSSRVIAGGDVSLAEVLKRLGMNVPKTDPQHCYLFSAEISDDLRRYHTDVHENLIAYVGGYDRYVHITYEVDGDNTEALAALDQFEYFYDNNGQQVEPSIDFVSDRRSCLSGFARGNQYDGYNEFSFCNQPNPLSDPMWEWDRKNFGSDVMMYNIINGWVHEYYHHVQKAHTLGRSLGMPADCCGGKNHTGSPAWFVEGQAQVFPTLFLREVFDDLQITKDLGLEGACAGDPQLAGNGPDQPLWERVAWQTNCNMTQKFESASKAIRGVAEDWDKCSGFSALEEMRETWTCAGHMEILNFYLAYLTSFETLFIDLHQDVWALGFDGALDLHYGLTKEELYADFNQFMIDNPSPPEGFFPTQPLTDLVDFWSIESG